MKCKRHARRTFKRSISRVFMFSSRKPLSCIFGLSTLTVLYAVYEINQLNYLSQVRKHRFSPREDDKILNGNIEGKGNSVWNNETVGLHKKWDLLHQKQKGAVPTSKDNMTLGENRNKTAIPQNKKGNLTITGTSHKNITGKTSNQSTKALPKPNKWKVSLTFRNKGLNNPFLLNHGNNRTAYVYKDVCIESDPIGKYKGNKIVIYNSGIKTHKKIFSFWVKFVPWGLSKKGSLVYHKDENAYFLKAKAHLYRNMDHCFKDISVTLFQLLQKQGHLTNTKNYLFTLVGRKPKPDWNFGWLHAMNINTTTYKTFHVSGPGLAPKTCFSKGIIADSTHSAFRGRMHRPQDVKALTKFLLNTYNISLSSCLERDPAQPQITIIERRERRKILNIQEVTGNLTQIGYTRVNSTAFEAHSLREQMLLAFCSDILIGVQGAGG